MHNTALKNFSYNPDKLYGDAGFRGEEDRKQYDERYVDHGKYIDPITKKPVETADPNMIASNDTIGKHSETTTSLFLVGPVQENLVL